MSINELNDPMDQNLKDAEGNPETSPIEKEAEKKANPANQSENEGEKPDQSIHSSPEDQLANESKQDTEPVSDEEPISDDTQEPVESPKQADSHPEGDEGKEEDEDEEAQQEKPTVDYQALSKSELVQKLKDLINNKPILSIKNEVETLKSIFYRKLKAEAERLRKAFIESGGEAEQFTLPEDNDEIQIKELLKIYREKKAKHNHELEEQKKKNLEAKLQVIEQIKALINGTESLNHTFQEFRQLQQQFREIGPVPQASLADLWENYHHHVQNFYDYIKINKELRDLDLKKNQEEKIKLCEAAEGLLLEPSIVTAFKKLQKLHEQWREIGPVPRENQNELWERFKEITAKINKKHQEHFEGLREEQKKNLEAKRALCEKAEELANLNITTNKEWNQRSKEMIELQKVWKTIGFAPKKDNTKIYERFRAACDAFFNKKREFYSEAKEEQANNLQLKTELCIQAESLMESTDWKKTTEEYILLQKRWKEIGPVPRKHSDEIWKRFRAACDHFFNRKSEHYAQIDGSYEANLKAKEELIAEIEAYQPDSDPKVCLEALKEFQRRWAEIGFVPIKLKDEIQKRYREAVNKQFEKLNIEGVNNALLQFRLKVEAAVTNPRQLKRIRTEREKLFNRLRKLENDIALWENNIGFFSRSKNAEAMIKEVERKITAAKEEIGLLEEKIKLIDNIDKE